MAPRQPYLCRWPRVGRMAADGHQAALSLQMAGWCGVPAASHDGGFAPIPPRLGPRPQPRSRTAACGCGDVASPTGGVTAQGARLSRPLNRRHCPPGGAVAAIPGEAASVSRLLMMHAMARLYMLGTDVAAPGHGRRNAYRWTVFRVQWARYRAPLAVTVQVAIEAPTASLMRVCVTRAGFGTRPAGGMGAKPPS